jgi:hypothetical protein
MMGASSNAPLADTQQESRNQLVHRTTAIAASQNMAPNILLKTVRTTGRSNNAQQYAIRCE